MQAGVGQSLAEAREAKFLETPRARVALISVASTFPDTRAPADARRHARASRPEPAALHDDHHSRPSRWRRSAALRRRPPGRPPGNRRHLNFSGAASSSAPRPASSTEPLKEDLDEIAAVVKNAAGLADYAIVTIHAHEGGARSHRAGRFSRDLRARDGGRRRRSVRRSRAARAARHRDLQGQADLLQPRRFHFPERDAAAAAGDNYEPYDLGADSHVNDFNDARYDFDKSGFPADPPDLGSGRRHARSFAAIN